MSRTISKPEKDLRLLFLSHAERHPKIHGEWAIFKFPKENTFLSMDTWNGDLRYAVGGGGYEYWSGFNGKTFIRFGGDDDGPVQPENVIRFYIEKVERELRR